VNAGETDVRARPWFPLLLALVVMGAGPPAAGAAEPQLVSSQALGRARSLMAAGDHDGAVAAATAVLVQQPGNGSAYLVLGMAHFRGGRYREALDAFQAARTAPAPPAPGPLAFNEGSTLFALARFEEAERAFQEAASRDGRLGPLAGLNAGQAALASGNLQRARAHLQAAEQQPGAAALASELSDLRADLEQRERDLTTARAEQLRTRARAALLAGRLQESIAGYREARGEAQSRGAPASERADLAYAEGVGTLRAGRTAEAAALFREAAQLEPADADYHYMWGLAAQRGDDPATARPALERALQLGLDPDDAATAREALDRMSLGLRRGGAGPSIGLELGAGYDSNVSQLSAGRIEGLSAEEPDRTGAPWGSLSLELALGATAGPRWFGEVAYWLEQRAYGDEAFDLYNLQSHQLSARGEWTPAGPWRLGLSLAGEYQLAGLRGFGFFQRALAIEPHLAFDEGPHTATVLRLHGRWQQAAPTDDHLDGRRAELWLGQIWRSRRLRAQVGLRNRRELVGTRTVDLSGLGQRGRFEGRYVHPYGYDGNALAADATVLLGDRWRLGLDASGERLRYRQDNVLTVLGLLGRTAEVARARREDRRFSGGAQLSFALTDALDLTGRYDLVVNRSNIAYDFDDKNYVKHGLFLALGVAY
jgi:tetratricopeptide (TPR) repeat protein